MKLKFSKTRKVKNPIRANTTDAGIDFFIPEFDEQFLTDIKDKNKAQISLSNIEIYSDSIIIRPSGRILIPSGVYVNIEEYAKQLKSIHPDLGLSLNVYNKSGVATKKGLDRLAEVIDAEYQGEMHLSLVNTSTESIVLLPNDKIVQMLLQPVFYASLEEIEFDNLYNIESSRGNKGFGSTDKK